MNKEKMVSIIIPVYNVEKYLAACIDSALAQTCKQIEIIIVDDGSTDHSPSICDEYAKLDNRVKVFHKKNGGPSRARNFGIKKCNGDFVFFLDGDDVIQKTTIETLLKHVTNAADIAICGLERFNNEYKNYNDYTDYTVSSYSPTEFFESIFRLNNATYACGTLIPRKLLDDNFFIPDRYFEDLSSMYKLYSRCNRINKIECGLYKYRNNTDSITNSPSLKKVNDYKISADEMISYVRRYFDIGESIINVYRCSVLRLCYIMTREDKYLIRAKYLAKHVSYSGMTMKNRIKIFLLRSTLMTKLKLAIGRKGQVRI